MGENQISHLRELRQIYRRRLNILEKQAASFGLSAPPHVLTEIEDIRKEITLVEAQLDALDQSSSQSLTTQATTVLFLSADPTDVSRLRLSEEVREIREKLQLAQWRDRFRLELRMSIRPADVSQALLDVQPQIVHFSGHGTETGALCFENQVGETHPIQPDALAALFEQFAHQVSCVLLNACYSKTQAKAIGRHIEYVIGMNPAISDKAAVAFAIGFYQALGAGRSIEDAHKLGCVQIQLQSISEHLTPVLIKNRRVKEAQHYSGRQKS